MEGCTKQSNWGLTIIRFRKSDNPQIPEEKKGRKRSDKGRESEKQNELVAHDARRVRLFVSKGTVGHLIASFPTA